MFETYLLIALKNLIKREMYCLKFFLTLLIGLGTLTNTASAQDTVLTVTYKGKLDSLHSNILKQKRLLQIFLPSDYKAGSTDKYDVLYVLDGGNWNTGLVTQIQHFIEGQSQMPPTIIVSVMGIDRNIELTPTQLSSWQAPTGGADQFLGFITKELIPYVNKTYPSNGVNSLWGHSLSGMFVMYTLLREPNAFTSYIAVDPSLWWDNSYVPKMAAEKLSALDGLNKTLFIGSRDAANFHEFKIDTMETILKKMAPPSLKWKLVAYSDETHSSVRLKSTYDGLRFTYAGYTRAIEFHPMNGIVLKNKPVSLWYFDDITRVHYTTDGTVPTESSAQVQPDITLNGPATVTYKRFTNRSVYDKIATGKFTTEKLPIPVSKLKNLIPGGFKYSYYEGDRDKIPDLKSMQPLKTGIFNKDFDAGALSRKNNYALAIDGFLEIKEDGYHIIILQAGNYATLYLGGKLLIQRTDKDSRSDYSYVVPLSKGFYPLRVEYFDKKEHFNLHLYYITPSTMASKDAVPIPLEVEYRSGK